jgi:hypothetical protein
LICRSRISYLEKIISALNDLKTRNSLSFELFCRDLLNHSLGYTIEVPKQRTQDGGVDFYGVYKDPVHQGIGRPPYRIFGQGKRWALKINPKEANHFIRQLEDFKKGHGRANLILPDDFKESKIPAYGYFWTSGFFTRDSKNVFAREAIYLKDGDQLAWGVILSEHEWFNDEGEFLFDTFLQQYHEKALAF